MSRLKSWGGTQVGVDMVIGIDGGGTHTRYLAVDTRGNVLAHLTSGPCTHGPMARAQQTAGATYR